MQGFKSTNENKVDVKKQVKADEIDIKQLKAELRYKEKALAETAANWSLSFKASRLKLTK